MDADVKKPSTFISATTTATRVAQLAKVPKRQDAILIRLYLEQTQNEEI